MGGYCIGCLPGNLLAFTKLRDAIAQERCAVAGEIWTITGLARQQQKEIKVYPNPAKDVINIELPYNEYAHGSIHNISGETVLSFEISGKNKLSVSGINSGLYFLQVTTRNQLCVNVV